MIDATDYHAVNALRFLAVDMIENAGSGHPGICMEAAPIVYTLFTKIMKGAHMRNGWDRFVLSCGHGSALLYAMHHIMGNHGINALRSFRSYFGFPGHPERTPECGIDLTTGLLGQGFASAVGLAIAKKKANELIDDVDNGNVWVLASDGDLMEGVSYEVASLAGTMKLGNLKVVYLNNKVSIDGPTDLTFTENVAGRFVHMGWTVYHEKEPENLEGLHTIFSSAAENNSPSIVIVDTVLGYGCPSKQGTNKAHGVPLGKDETLAAKMELNYPTEPTFHVNSNVYSRVEEELKAKEGTIAVHREPILFPGWDFWDGINFPDAPISPRDASGIVLKSLSENFSKQLHLIGGSADLTESTRAGISEERFIHFGVREHAMAAVMNGIAASDVFVPYCSTYLAFSDYMRPAMRMAAMMKLGVIYLLTHDGLSAGQDGATHQAIEHLAALRSIPNLTVIRPADAQEVKEAWKAAICRRSGPTAIILSRDVLPPLKREEDPGTASQGAYVLSKEATPEPEAVIMASGSEVQLALEAKMVLGDGIRVVSFPSWELFEEHTEEFKREIIPEGVKTVAVEAGVSQGWHKYAQKVVSIENFGASAPSKDLNEIYGMCVDNIIRAVRG